VKGKDKPGWRRKLLRAIKELHNILCQEEGALYPSIRESVLEISDKSFSVARMIKRAKPKAAPNSKSRKAWVTCWVRKNVRRKARIETQR